MMHIDACPCHSSLALYFNLPVRFRTMQSMLCRLHKDVVWYQGIGLTWVGIGHAVKTSSWICFQLFLNVLRMVTQSCCTMQLHLRMQTLAILVLQQVGKLFFKLRHWRFFRPERCWTRRYGGFPHHVQGLRGACLKVKVAWFIWQTGNAQYLLLNLILDLLRHHQHASRWKSAWQKQPRRSVRSQTSSRHP